jgi:prepilin-type N-terminal cleavage/methylation domain-containing protein
MNKNYKFRCQGVTLIEVLLVLGVLVIIASFAAPSLTSATTRSEMRAVAENIQYSIRIAQNTARMTETGVSLNVHSDPASEIHRISYSVSDRARTAVGPTGLQEYKLDSDFILLSDHASYEFDGRGIVKNPGKIVLAARGDESITTIFKVE